MERQKTKSKEYYDDEIIAVLQDGSIYLKPGVIRQPKYRFSTEHEESASHFNTWVYHRDRTDRIKKQIEEDNDWN